MASSPGRPGSQQEEGLLAWIILIVAGLFEIVWAYFMKQSQGFTRLVPTVITFVTMFISFGLLSISMKTLPLGTAYAVWTGVGALGAFLVGVVVLNEPAGAMRIGAAALIVAGLALMKIATPT
jgi:quaternary ammonium compound-resistance protein SugE